MSLNETHSGSTGRHRIPTISHIYSDYVSPKTTERQNALSTSMYVSQVFAVRCALVYECGSAVKSERYDRGGMSVRWNGMQDTMNWLRHQTTNPTTEMQATPLLNFLINFFFWNTYFVYLETVQKWLKIHIQWWRPIFSPCMAYTKLSNIKIYYLDECPMKGFGAKNHFVGARTVFKDSIGDDHDNQELIWPHKMQIRKTPKLLQFQFKSLIAAPHSQIIINISDVFQSQFNQFIFDFRSCTLEMKTEKSQIALSHYDISNAISPEMECGRKEGCSRCEQPNENKKRSNWLSKIIQIIDAVLTRIVNMKLIHNSLISTTKNDH